MKTVRQAAAGVHGAEGDMGIVVILLLVAVAMYFFGEDVPQGGHI